MKATLTHSATVLLLVSLALSWSTARTRAAQSKPRPPAPAAAPTNAVQNTISADIPKSVFVVSSNPRELRNPFFPSVYAPPTPVLEVVRQNNKPAQVDTSRFVLNGITPSGSKPTAMINSHTFESGETGEVKLPNGEKVLIKCEEIRSESVIIIAEGQRRELKIRFGL